MSFADPIATELKAPKSSILDDSIMLIKCISFTTTQINEVDLAATNSSRLNSPCTEANVNSKEKEWGQDGLTVITNITSEQTTSCDSRVTELIPTHFGLNVDHVSVEASVAGGKKDNTYSGITPSEITANAMHFINPTSSVFAGVPQVMTNTAPSLTSTEPEISKTGVESQVDMGKQLGMLVLGQLQGMLVSSPDSHDLNVADQQLNVSSNNIPSIIEQPSPVQNINSRLDESEPVMQDLLGGADLEHNTNDDQQLERLDVFLNSISTSISQPLLTPKPQQTWFNQRSSPPLSTNKRQSSRLAQKAIANSGKGSMEIAHDLLVKKLGNLAGIDNTSIVKHPCDDFDLYVQHFARPVEKTTMDAIQDLIEHGAKIQKKAGDQREAAGTPGRVA